MNTYVPIFRDLDARGGKKAYKQAHTRARGTTTVTTIVKFIRSAEAHTYNIYCTNAKMLNIKPMR